MTWKEIITIEPKVEILRIRANKYRNACGKHISAQRKSSKFYSIFKPEIERLVGWDSGNPILASCDVYDTVYHTILDSLYFPHTSYTREADRDGWKPLQRNHLKEQQ